TAGVFAMIASAACAASSDPATDVDELSSAAVSGCSHKGVRGTCQDVSSCTRVSPPRVCPGPANIPCCTPGGGGAACAFDSDCPAGHPCHHGQCAAGGSECASDSDCPAGHPCHHGQCAAGGSECAFDSDCPAGHPCHHGQCAAGGSECAFDSDCPTGHP